MYEVISHDKRDTLKRFAVIERYKINEELYHTGGAHYLSFVKDKMINALRERFKNYSAIGLNVLTTKRLDKKNILLTREYNQNAGEKETIAQVVFFEYIVVA